MARAVSLTIAHLYPRDMNIYGDTGNVLVLRRRLEWRGLGVRVMGVNPGEQLPGDTDIIISGGGQDKGQMIVEADLQERQAQLRQMRDDGVVMLVVCGTYQLFGHRFITQAGEELKGISLFDLETAAGPERHIGNIVIKTEWGELVGYENHSGLTRLFDGQQALGEVIKGAGNNGQDGAEGAQVKNTFGTYLHGPLLPKNPHFADELLRRALERKYGQADLAPLDDRLAQAAAETARSRPR